MVSSWACRIGGCANRLVIVSTGDWIASISAAFAAVGVIVAGVGVMAALRGVRDQLRMTTFIEYTKRYATIMASLPFDARKPDSGYDLASVSETERRRVLGVFRDYFNLCSEENWLHATGKLDADTWRIWKLGMKQVAASPAFAGAWDSLRDEYAVFRDFITFMDSEIVGRDYARES